MNRKLTLFVALLLTGLTSPCHAGPPFMTDDPEPTETGHYEIYGPQLEMGGSGGNFEGTAGVEVNYGPVKDVQLTLGLPMAFSHDSSGWRSGADDIKASVKYRFFNDEAERVQIAVFPGMSIPTGSNGFGAGHVTGFVPIWAQKEIGKWVMFGGGGYALNPGSGNRDYWVGAFNLSRKFSEKLLVGIEAQHQGADVVGGDGSTSLGLGFIYNLKEPFRIMMSAGPTFADTDGAASFHSFIALGINF